MENDVCVLKEQNAFRGEWRLCRVSQVFPDDDGMIRNVEVMVKPRQGGSVKYVVTKPIYLNRHVSNLVVIEGADDQDHLPVRDEAEGTCDGEISEQK